MSLSSYWKWGILLMLPCYLQYLLIKLDFSILKILSRTLIKGLPEELFPLGSLVYQETFLVLTIKSQSQVKLQFFGKPLININPISNKSLCHITSYIFFYYLTRHWCAEGAPLPRMCFAQHAFLLCVKCCLVVKSITFRTCRHPQLFK